MAPAGPPTYVFLSWVRQGLASAIASPNAGQPLGVATVSASATVEGEAVQVPMRLHGPGDIRALDTRLVLRTEPVPGATDFEPNHFAMVEFSRADLPWLFTPAPPAGERLQPWLCLVVMPQAAVTGPSPSPAGPLPVLTVDAAELPPLADSALAAHVQVTVLPGQQPQDLVAAGSSAAVSHLVSFRNLQPHTRYIAAVVPAFALGVKAGLGGDVTAQDEQQLAPAWAPGATGPVTLPVYYSWEFATGDAGDFAALAASLAHRAPALPPAVGQRPLDVSAPGYGLPAAGGPLGLGGAIMPVGMSLTQGSGSAYDAFQSALTGLLNRGATADPPLVAPPVYGGWPAGQATIGGSPAWLTELNLDPRYRVAASLGAAVVHREQEQLMASAWDQLAHLREANRVLRQSQLAGAIASAVHQAHLAPLAGDLGRLLQVTRPVHSRALVGGATLTSHVARSSLPDGAVSPALRRLASPQRPLARRLTANGGPLPSMIARLVAGQVRTAPPRGEPAGSALASRVTAAAGAPFADVALSRATAGALNAAPGWQQAPPAPALVARNGGRVDWGDDPADGGIPHPPGFDDLDPLAFALMKRTFAQAAGRQQTYLAQLAALPADQPAPPLLDLTSAAILPQLQPAPAVLAATGARLGFDPPANLDPLTVAPVFPQAMVEPLAALSVENLLPGVSAVPDDCLQQMWPDLPFIEAYLVGLNHEMARELLWRGFPTPRRATFFHRFWNASGADIADVSAWKPALPLGGNAAAAASAQLPLLIRSRLLGRYPSTSVYAQQAVAQGTGRTPGGPVKEPVFRAALGGDALLLGFDLNPAEALGNAKSPQGWFIVIEQHTQEPGFGLGKPNGANANPTSWDQVSWSSLAANDSALKDLRFASMNWGRGGRLTVPLSSTVGAPDLTWGSDAAQMASICLRSPVRLAIHASMLLPPGR